ncbi:MAG: hypothetical protein KME32_14890 [Mojavia pulchra JT2-VF2]|uniref:Uncharacterized protein n=1 Tax=Mojavia pulchra JT2-VF2 TaxID=287848 RepID=A0A951PZ99_9NOST|nr:hypothetical protein [Mojavia pulchra JT2-VF2]
MFVDLVLKTNEQVLLAPPSAIAVLPAVTYTITFEPTALKGTISIVENLILSLLAKKFKFRVPS